MENMNIWFTVSEAQGLVKSGGLADVAKALPKALQELGNEVAIVLPGYSLLPNREDKNIILSTELEHWPHTAYQVATMELDGVPVYTIECDHYFERNALYAENNEAYKDNGERFAFFAAASLDVLPKLGIKPDVVHANDWHTGLVPFLLKTRYQSDERFSGIKSVLTVHNAIFKGIFKYDDLEIIPELHFSSAENVRYGHDCISTLRAGIAYADKVNAVSPNYAKELMTPLGAHGLVDDFSHRSRDLHGIVNGCDYSEWDPNRDELLPKTYTDNAQSMKAGKLASKTLIQQELGLPNRDLPLFGMVCRLTHQKGFHYILPMLQQFLTNDVQLVIVGTGDPDVAAQLRNFANAYPTKFAFLEAYSDRYAHLVEAGSDFFLMPSEFEACGLNQIYSMAYGTLPIVREVGGLKDTVVNYDESPEKGTGFSFREPSAQALLVVMQRAVLFYLQSPEEMTRIQLQAMRVDFSWLDSAKEYKKMYQLAFLEH
ncbi:starch synthase [Vibrio sp. 10N.286.49.B3]|uniref:glycogen synthase GlgA n=1 Tax=Vibrio sp. 10N.286.49.B3 TaxID=1880855 RepID=UPI000C81B28D|nr:glycogen synthase GlgA [Vibrio sp. 10N.286.49.B3]PMH44965.1 starch synthase [Vibrio sp. 10N.286.49.B3]